MRTRHAWWAVGAAALLGAGLLGCASPRISDYAGAQPTLDLIGYFEGRSEAWGMLQRRGGKLQRHFYAAIEGREEGGKLILDERFEFNDGELQRRVWTFTPQGEGRWSGTAGDVVGEADLRVAGNAIHLRYTLAVPISGRIFHMQMDDWMFLLDERTLVNRTSMRKFGLEAAEITVFFRKLADGDAPDRSAPPATSELQAGSD